jgi:hypothetical protein
LSEYKAVNTKVLKSVDDVIDFAFQLLEKYELKKREDELKQKRD